MNEAPEREAWVLDERDKDIYNPDPLAQLCEIIPLWGRLDSFLSRNMYVCLPLTIIAAVLVGVWLKWLGVHLPIISDG